MDRNDFIQSLPLPARLALAYAPARARAPTLAVLALDARLAGVVRGGREPLLAQVRLAWWREQLAQGAGKRAAGEPLLALIGQEWGEVAPDLIGLVEGWEQMLASETVGSEQVSRLAEARGKAWAGLAALLDCPDCEAGEALHAGRGWSLAEIAAAAVSASELEAALALIAEHDWREPRLSRAMRAPAVLYRLGARARGMRPLLSRPIDLVSAIGLGLFGG